MTENRRNFSLFLTNCPLISRTISSAQPKIFWRPRPRWTTGKVKKARYNPGIEGTERGQAIPPVPQFISI
jgi:hypothetical protein